MKSLLHRATAALLLAAAASLATAAAPAASAASVQTSDDVTDFFRWVDIDNDSGVAQLLKQGFDPNTRDTKGQVALFVALRAKSVKVAKVLWEAPGIRIDARNQADETPLMMAAMRGQARRGAGA